MRAETVVHDGNTFLSGRYNDDLSARRRLVNTLQQRQTHARRFAGARWRLHDHVTTCASCERTKHRVTLNARHNKTRLQNARVEREESKLEDSGRNFMNQEAFETHLA